MLCTQLKEFVKFIPKDKCIMSLDLGRKKIGIAFSDITNLIATPHSVYYRQNIRKDIGFLNRLFEEGDAGSMVIGLPTELKAGDNLWHKIVLDFANRIVKKYNIIVYLQDESLSTIEATEALITAGLSYHKSKKLNDKVSAAIILQRTLDAINKL
ncbi:MAG: putative pre-16S rRNA nuclease [Candidatus Mesenet longicola]|uniref:Putative pre-16S rRNA nuclease n=1 Tax=Candidatus Mesenet longicola TaxID=1892558 RepID=A0A8J3HT52_9RICK|nr:MAG: putative pre-16S rRNA nuclease [Candidatus Mesenet longicola]GHM59783.1 MAG: putative pre-16S rRNA nuclease [Candidatus Mesenet longicola]